MNTILVVDDTEVNLVLIESLVNKLGDCVAATFQKPMLAFEWCRKNTPDVVLVDYMMPEMDGLQFIEAFRALYSRDEVPVLMITANDQKEVQYKALLNGANDFLSKPIDSHEFIPRMRNMLSMRTGQKFLNDRALHLSSLVDEKVKDIRQRERELVLRLSRAAEFRDPETGSHIQRMANYSRLIADRLGLGSEELDLILESAPMHDIGKIGIPDFILLKPGRLTPEVFELMKTHAQLGHELLKESPSKVMQAGSEIALSHHEKYDGTGYPRGTKGEDIPIYGRIVAVADVFDALTSARPYKKAWSLEDSRQFLIDCTGTHFDPGCVDAFVKAWDDAIDVRKKYGSDEEQQLVPFGEGMVSAELLSLMR